MKLLSIPIALVAQMGSFGNSLIEGPLNGLHQARQQVDMLIHTISSTDLEQMLRS